MAKTCPAELIAKAGRVRTSLLSDVKIRKAETACSIFRRVNRQMVGKTKERWRALCDLAAVVDDPKMFAKSSRGHQALAGR